MKATENGIVISQRPSNKILMSNSVNLSCSFSNTMLGSSEQSVGEKTYLLTQLHDDIYIMSIIILFSLGFNDTLPIY